ncbi:MAG: tetratricopeptide repeat protein, partial [Microcoleus sp.]
MNTIRWKNWFLVAGLTAFLCCLQVPVSAIIQASNTTEILRRQLVAAQNLESAGLYRQACNTLLPVLELAEFDCANLIDNQISPTEKAIIENLPNSEISASGLRILGDVLRLTGALKNSQIILNRSLAAAQNLQMDAAVSAAYLSLGNTQGAFGKRQEDIKKDAEPNYEKALDFYERAIAISASTQQLQAKLNKLRLLVSNLPNSDIGNLWQEIKSKVDKLPATTQSIYDRINFAESLGCLSMEVIEPHVDTIKWPFPPAVNRCAVKSPRKNVEPPALIYVAKLLATAAYDADKLGNLRAESYAKGSLG